MLLLWVLHLVFVSVNWVTLALGSEPKSKLYSDEHHYSHGSQQMEKEVSRQMTHQASWGLPQPQMTV